MRIHIFSALPLAAAIGTALAAQTAPRIITASPGGGGAYDVYQLTAAPRVAVGLTTATSSTASDTLGALVTAVATGSPAEKAGIREGDRIAAINGVSLQLAAADIGDPDMGRAVGRRLTRELGRANPGDDIELKVNAGGRIETKKVKTVAADDLYAGLGMRTFPMMLQPSTSVGATPLGGGLQRASAASSWSGLTTLGISTATTGSKRDTLGVFVMAVVDAGPAAKAGIEEGSRIASINGVDLRVAHDDAGDDAAAMDKLHRLETEIAHAKPGDQVALDIWANGQRRSVKATVGQKSDFSPQRHAITIVGDGGTMSIGGTGMVDGTMQAMVDRVRQNIDQMRGQFNIQVGPSSPGLEHLLPGSGASGTIRWLVAPDSGMFEPMANTKPTAVPASWNLRRIVM